MTFKSCLIDHHSASIIKTCQYVVAIGTWEGEGDEIKSEVWFIRENLIIHQELDAMLSHVQLTDEALRKKVEYGVISSIMCFFNIKSRFYSHTKR